jgi:hypothetical protein
VWILRTARLLTETFEIPAPSAVINIIGSDRYKSPFADQHELVFKEGLAYAAGQSQAWIVTSGAREGSASLVASAFSVLHEQPPIIGVVPFGAVNEHETFGASKNARGSIYLYGSSESVARPRRSKSSSATSKNGRASSVTCRSASVANRLSTQRRTHKPGEPGEERINLEPSHFAFLMADDGTTGKLGGELELRHEVLQYITNNDLSNDGVRTPTLTLLLGDEEVDTSTNMRDLRTIVRTLEGKVRRATRTHASRLG